MFIREQYVTRKPVLSQAMISHIFQVTDAEKYLLDLIQDDLFLERILVASPDLYEELERIKRNDKRIQLDTIHKVFKYLLRMSSRPMPFGLFSGISRAHFTESKVNTTYKKARASVEWLANLAKLTEAQLEYDSSVSLYLNDQLRVTKEYIYLDVAKETETKRIEFKRSAFISETIDYLQSPRTIKEFIQFFSDGRSTLKTTILRSLKTLLQHDFLYTSLRPNSILDQTSGLDHILEELDHGQDQLYAKLLAIKQAFIEYEQRAVGQGIQAYLDLQQKMRDVCLSKRYIVVDLFQEDHAPQLKKKEVEQFLEDIRFLRAFDYLSLNHKTWEEYCNKFLNEYGLFHERPLLDVIDTDTGIGLPNVLSSMRKSAELKWDSYMLNLIQESHIQQQSCIRLSSSQIDTVRKILEEGEIYKLQDGYDVKFHVVDEEGQEKFLLTENAFSPVAGSFSGRFYDSLSQDSCSKYEDEEYISAEINAVPLQYGDIGVTYCPADYQICFNTAHHANLPHLKLHDLYLGMDHQGLYIKSKAMNKKVIPITTHLLHYSNFNENPVLIFLSEFGKFITAAPENFTFGWQSKLTYIPRIEYQNIILSPSRWNLQYAKIMAEIQEQDVTDREYLQDFMKRYGVPRVVHLLTGDQTLPVLTDTELGVTFILDELKRRSSVTLLEAVEVNLSTGSNTTYITDYIVTVLPEKIKKSSAASAAQEADPHMCSSQIDSMVEYDLSWCYFNIYYRKGKRLATLQLCLDFAERLGIEKYFAIHYLDPHEHIRFRLKNASMTEKEEFRAFLIRLVEEQEVKRFTEDLFLPEVERYGGELYSTHAYDLFCLETKWLYQLFCSHFFRGRAELETGVFICLYTVMDMFDSFEEGRRFLEWNIQGRGKRHMKAFKKNRNYYVALGQEAIGFYDPNDQLLRQKRKKYRGYVQQIRASFSEERAYYTLQSMVHMTMNRFIGTERKLEEEVYEYACYTYYNLKYQLEILGGYHEIV